MDDGVRTSVGVAAVGLVLAAVCLTVGPVRAPSTSSSWPPPTTLGVGLMVIGLVVTAVAQQQRGRLNGRTHQAERIEVGHG